MKRVYTLLALVVMSLALISCAEGDRLVGSLKGDSGGSDEYNYRTFDVRTETAELVTLGVLQATLFAHLNSGLNDYLDASDLPDNAVPTGTGDNAYYAACDNGGSVELEFPRAAGEGHKIGDRISVKYSDCDRGDGIVRNGTMTARYSEMKDLNDRFVEIDTDTCVANLRATLSNSARIINVVGDDIVFVEYEDTLRVKVDDVDTGAIIGKNETAIVVKQLADPEIGAVTSVNGDQVYSVVSRVSKKELCQEYRRTLTATLKEFSSQKDDLKTTLSGTIDLFSGTQDLKTFVAKISDSSFSTAVKQGNLEEVFTLSNYTITQTFSPSRATYAYEIETDISSDTINGIASVLWAVPIMGHFSNPYPYSGILSIQGRGQEQIAFGINDLRLTINVDNNGDSTGNGKSDFEDFISSSWPELVAREFKLSE